MGSKLCLITQTNNLALSTDTVAVCSNNSPPPPLKKKHRYSELTKPEF